MTKTITTKLCQLLTLTALAACSFVLLSGFVNNPGPRVFDDADLLTPAEEAQIEAAISAATETTNKDFVVKTVSTGAKDHALASADFYDDNGFGTGAENEGYVFYVCMDPDHRGFWTTVTGPDTRSLYTEKAANVSDDDVQPLMRSGEYATAALTWVRNMETLSIYGYVHVPAWLPTRQEATLASTKTAKRVVNDAPSVDIGNLDDLNATADRLSQQYGLDVVVYVLEDFAGIPKDDLATMYYQTFGFGQGQNRSGLLLVASKTGSNTVKLFGDASALISEDNARELGYRFSDDFDFNQTTAVKTYLNTASFTLEKGHLPRTTLAWVVFLAVALFVGFIVCKISLDGADSSMKAPARVSGAASYLLPDSFKKSFVSSKFLGSVRTRRRLYHATSDDSSSSSSSSSSRSDYRRSYTSSSGVEHTGSGRSF